MKLRCRIKASKSQEAWTCTFDCYARPLFEVSTCIYSWSDPLPGTLVSYWHLWLLLQNIPGAIFLRLQLLCWLCCAPKSTVHVSWCHALLKLSVLKSFSMPQFILCSSYMYYLLLSQLPCSCIYCKTLFWFVNSRGLALQCSIHPW